MQLLLVNYSGNQSIAGQSLKAARITIKNYGLTVADCYLGMLENAKKGSSNNHHARVWRLANDAAKTIIENRGKNSAGIELGVVEQKSLPEFSLSAAPFNHAGDCLRFGCSNQSPCKYCI